MTSNNENVQVESNAIAVLSHPSNTAYQIDSDTVVSALSADKGWTLKYVNSSKVEKTVSHVKSGFIKASHNDYQDVYIPITYKGAVIDNDHSDNAATIKGTSAKATYAYTDGTATFTAGATAIDGYAYTGIGNGATNADAIKKLPYTVSFKMRVTGNAIGVVNYRWDGDEYNIIRVNGDGSYTHMNNANQQVSGGTLTKDAWHDIKIVYDAPVNRFQLWVDGECKTSDIGTIPTGYYSKIVFAIASGSQNGTVEFKDFDTNYGYYYQPFTPTASYLISTMISDNERVVIGGDAISVYSHPSSPSYQISSTALLSTLTVEDGWTLKFTNDNKTEETVSHVKSGFIKASHPDYQDVYIPVTHRGDDIPNNIGTTAKDYGNASTAATYSYADGVVTFTAGATALTGYKMIGIGDAAGNEAAIKRLPYTLKFKMKTTGDATGVVNMRNESDGQNLLRFNADGTLQYRGTTNNMLDGGQFTKDAWHDVVLVYDQPNNRYQIWVDGVCLIENSGTVAGNASTYYSAKIVFAMATGSKNGTVSFKDFEGYYGYYYPLPEDKPHMSITDVSTGEKTTFTLNLQSPDTISGVVFVATYAKNTNTLVSVQRYDAAAQRDIEVNTPNGEDVKIMWWDITTGMNPVTGSIVVK